MVDFLSSSASQPLGHHQPLGNMPLGVLNLAYFFPTGLPDSDPLDEVATQPSEASSLSRKLLPEHSIPTVENSIYLSGTTSGGFVQAQPSQPEIANLDGNALLSSGAFPIQRTPLIEEAYPQNSLSNFGLDSEKESHREGRSSRADIPKNATPKYSSISENPLIQKRSEIEGDTLDKTQNSDKANFESHVIQDNANTENIGNDIISQEALSTQTLAPEEISLQKHGSAENVTVENTVLESSKLSESSPIQKYALSDSRTMEDSLVKPNSSVDLNSNAWSNSNRTAIENTSINNISTEIVSSSNVNGIQRHLLSQKDGLEKDFPQTISSSEGSSIHEANTIEYKPLSLDADLENSAIQRAPISISGTSELNRRSKVTFSSTNVADEGFSTEISNSNEEKDYLTPLSTTQYDHTSAENILSNSRSVYTEEISIPTQFLQAKHDSSEQSSDFQPASRISPTPGTQAHPQLDQNHLPIIIDFSTPPTPIQPQKISNNDFDSPANLSSEAIDISLYQQVGSIEPKPLFESEQSPSQNLQNIVSSSSSFASEAISGDTIGSPKTASLVEDWPLSATTTQKTHADTSDTSIANPLNSETQPLNHGNLSNIKDSASKIIQHKSEDNSVSLNISLNNNKTASSDNLVKPQPSSILERVDSEDLQKTSQDIDESLEFSPTSSAATSLNIESLSGREESESQISDQPLDKSPQKYRQDSYIDHENRSLFPTTSSFNNNSTTNESSSRRLQRSSEDDSTLAVGNLSSPVVTSLEPISEKEPESLSSAPTQRTEDSESTFLSKQLSILPHNFREIKDHQGLETASQSQYQENTESSDEQVITNSQDIDSIQRTSEGGSTASINADSTVIGQSLVLEASDKAQISPSNQTYRTSELISLSSADNVPLLKKEALLTIAEPITEESRSNQSQQAKIDKSAPTAELESSFNVTNLASENSVSGEKTIPNQIHRSSEESSLSSTNAADILVTTFVLESDTLAIVEDTLDRSLQKASEASFPESKSVSSEQIEDMSEIEVESINNNFPSHVERKTSENFFSLSADLSSIPETSSLSSRDLTSAENLLPSQVQRSSNGFSLSIADSSPLSKASNLSSKDLTCAEEIMSSHIQKFTEGTFNSSVESASHPDADLIEQTPYELDYLTSKKAQKSSSEFLSFLNNSTFSETEKLPNKNQIYVQLLSCDDSQTIGQENSISPINAITTPSMTEIEDQSISADDTSPEPIQETKESLSTLSEKNVPKTNEDTYPTQEENGLEDNLSNQIQRSEKGESVELPKVLSTAKAIDLDPNLTAKNETPRSEEIQRFSGDAYIPFSQSELIGERLGQQVRRDIGDNSSSSRDTLPASIYSDFISDTPLNIQPSAPKQSQQVSDLNISPLINTLPTSASPESSSIFDSQDLSFQTSRDIEATSPINESFTSILNVQEPSLEAKSISNSEKLFLNSLQDCRDSNFTILTDINSTVITPSLVSESLIFESPSHITGASLNQIQKSSEDSYSSFEAVLSHSPAEKIASESIPNFKEELPGNIQRSNENSSIFLTNIQSNTTTISQNHNIVTRTENTSPGNTESRNSTGLAVPSDSLSILPTPFLSPEMLSVNEETLFNAIQCSYEIDDSAQANPSSLPQATSLSNEPWHGTGDILAEPLPRSTQINLAPISNLSSDIVQKFGDNDDISMPTETISSIVLSRVARTVDLEYAKPDDIQNSEFRSSDIQSPEIQNISSSISLGRSQEDSLKPQSLSHNQELLSGSIQRSRAIEMGLSDDTVTVPIVTSFTSSKVSQSSNISPDSIQKFQVASDDEDTSLISTFPVSSSSQDVETSLKKVSSYTQNSSIPNNESLTYPHSPTPESHIDTLTPRDVSNTVNISASDIQRTGERTSILLPEIKSIALTQDSIAPESLPVIIDFQSVPYVLQRKPEINLGGIESDAEARAISNQDLGIGVDLSMKQNINFGQTQDVSSTHTSLPVQDGLDVADNQSYLSKQVSQFIPRYPLTNTSSESSILRKTENNDRSDSSELFHPSQDVDCEDVTSANASSYHHESQEKINYSADYQTNFNIELEAKSLQGYLHSSSLFAGCNETPGLQYKADSSNEIYQLEINHLQAQLSEEPLEVNQPQTQLSELISSNTIQRSSIHTWPVQRDDQPSSASSQDVAQGDASQKLWPTQPQRRIDQTSHVSDLNLEVTKPLRSIEQVESNLLPAFLSSSEDSTIQRSADNPLSDLPMGWQSLADLVASQQQTDSKSPEVITVDSIDPNLSIGQTAKQSYPSTTPLVSQSPASTVPVQRKLSVSRSKPIINFRKSPTAIQAQTSVSTAPSTANLLIQADSDAPFTTIESSQNRESENHSTKSWALEQLAQEMYYRMRQRLVIEKERHGRFYDKRLK